MRRFVVRSVLLAALSAGPALAADIPALPGGVYSQRPVASGVFSWTSWYVGGFVGGAWSRDAITGDPCNVDAPRVCWLSAAGGETVSYPVSSSFIGGATAGYNYHIPGHLVVFGLETEFSYLGLTGSSSFAGVSAAALAPNLVASATIGNWYNATTGRIGVAWDTLLFYAKLGFSIGTNESTLVDTTGLLSGSGKIDLLMGWAWGGGVEWVFAPNWSVKGEYLWIGLNDTVKTCAIAAGASPFAGSTFCANTSTPPVQTAKIGVNYLLNAGPVYSRY